MNRRLIALLIVSALILSTGCLFKSEKSSESVSSGKPVNIPAKIFNDKFGFLAGPPESYQGLKARGAAWARPHPGPFLWDSMQKGKNKEISFGNTDDVVSSIQEKEAAILATIWPFAEWDQNNKSNPDKYKVSENDEFLKEANEERPYLPFHRGNPADWMAYKKWVKSLVERYDGDGKEDMPGLEIPIKYWEVMNEPDLTSPEPEPRLDFYTEDAAAYATLLIKTSEAIKEADPKAKVLIAGAAGGNDEFLSFYRDVFKNKEAVSAFDIANVHCISNDSFDSFNVEPYQKMLKEMGIDKPIWVTEAEAMISDDPDINATQTYESTKKALEFGAEKIFFTRFEFQNSQMGGGGPPKPQKPVTTKATIQGGDPIEAYKKITGLD